jgi:predicted metal-dependent hydrolase
MDPSTRSVATRRIEFEHEVTNRHFVADDLLTSNVLAVLSSMFPKGESFFADTVRHYRPQIEDPELRRQIAGFIGQETLHGREHDRLNGVLQEHGYPTEAIDRDIGRLFAVVERVVPPKLQLAMTAAMEHVTAVVGEYLLSDVLAEDEEGLSDELRDMLRWHALEECEHKAVAFDTLAAVDGDERVRVAGMALTLAIVGPFLIGALVRSVGADPDIRRPWRLLRSARALRESPLARSFLLRRLAEYVRRGFHPDDNDTSELVVQWRDTLFGAEGTLRERTAVGAVA